MKKTLFVAGTVAILGACKSDGEFRSATNQDHPGYGSSDDRNSSNLADASDPWSQYFVTSFDPAQIDRIRKLPGYIANQIQYRLTIPGHPPYNTGRTVRSNPLAAARLDYALSTGLTGKGQIISVIDDEIRASHEQFAGKTIYQSGSTSSDGDYHGTAVASVAAGTGANGGALGFAPGADLHMGKLDYRSTSPWNQLAQNMRDAASLGAVVSNNSWGLSDATVATFRPRDLMRGSERLGYLSSLRSFAQEGVIVFAMQNDYHATSASVMAALPLDFPDLEPNWISVVNAIPTFDAERILAADRISAPCLETARFCMAANGQIKVATEAGDTSYRIGGGASFAAPQVAGSVALLAEAFPDLSASQIRDRLLATADNSFFEHTKQYTFAPGISHGYNEEFGHGFLNLRDALLPIGDAVIPTQAGTSIPVGRAAIATGPASGGALAHSMQEAMIVSLDGLHGHFSAPAAIVSASSLGPDIAATALAHATRASAATGGIDRVAADRFSRLGFLGLTATETALGAGQTVLHEGEDFQLAVIGANERNGALGLAARHSLDYGSTELTVGASVAQGQGSVMGVTVPGREREIYAQIAAIDLGVSHRLDEKGLVSVEVEFGRATGNGAGIVNDISALDFNRLNASWSQADVANHGDLLSVSLATPIAITRGQADMTLPTSYANGSVGYSRHAFDLAPSKRQIDVSMTYTTPIAEGWQASVGAVYSWNHGHDSNKMDAAAVAALQVALW